MHMLHQNFLFSILVTLSFSLIAMEQPPVPAQLHQQFAHGNAQAYYDAVSNQRPSYVSQVSRDIVVQSGAQIITTVIMLGITSAYNVVHYLVKGPTEEQRQFDVILAKNENTNRQNALILQKEETKANKEDRQELLTAITELMNLPDTIVSSEEKKQAKQEFLKAYIAILRKKQEKLPALSAEEMKTILQG